MNSLRSHLAIAILTATAAFAAEPAPAPADNAPPELRGVLIAGSDRRFALCTPNSTTTEWVALGESFQGWKLADYRQADETLVVKKDGKETLIKLAASQTGHIDAKATVADAEVVFRKMNFDAMLDKILANQKQASVNMIRQMAARAGGRGGASPEAMADFQKKIMDVMFEQLNSDSLHGDIAKIFADVYTKEELAGMADFYGTPLGQAVTAKQPEMQQKMSELMQSRIVTAIPKVQQMAAEFQQQQQAQQQAQAPAAATPAPGK